MLVALTRVPGDAGEAVWCDPAADPAARASALLAEMTLQEKASNMDSHNFGDRTETLSWVAAAPPAPAR